MRENTTRNIRKDLRLQNLNTGKHERSWFVRRGHRHPPESDDQTVLHFHDAETFAKGIRNENESCQRVSATMCLKRLTQIDISDILPVTATKGSTLSRFLSVINAS